MHSIDWLIDMMIDIMIDWLIDIMIDWLIDWYNDWLTIGLLTYWANVWSGRHLSDQAATWNTYWTRPISFLLQTNFLLSIILTELIWPAFVRSCLHKTLWCNKLCACCNPLCLVFSFLWQTKMNVLQVTDVIEMPCVKTQLDRIHVLVLMVTLAME